MVLHRFVWSWSSRCKLHESGHFDSAATQYRIYRLMYNKSSPHYRQIWTSRASPIIFTPNIFNLPFIHQIIGGDVRCCIDRHRFDCEYCRSIFKTDAISVLSTIESLYRRAHPSDHSLYILCKWVRIVCMSASVKAIILVLKERLLANHRMKKESLH